MMVGGHHGYWRDPIPGGDSVVASGDELIAGWSGQQDAHLRAIEDVCGLRAADLPALPHDPVSSAFFVCASGLLTMADWLASDDLQVNAGKALWTKLSASGQGPETSAIAAQAWMKARGPGLRAHVDSSLGAPSTVTRTEINKAILGDYDPRPLQAEALARTAESDAGLWICMYPTGDGKTEAALLRGAVDPTEGLFFGLPTLATTDAMEARLDVIDDRLGRRMPLTKSHQFADLMREASKPEVSEGDCAGDPAGAWYPANLFFQLVSSRYEHASLILTSNLPFARWGDVFGDQVVAAAMIDRIVHHAEVITLKGSSHRLRNTGIDTLPSTRAENTQH